MINRYFRYLLLMVLFGCAFDYSLPVHVTAQTTAASGSESQDTDSLLTELQQNADQRKTILEVNLPDLKKNMADNEAQIKQLREQVIADRKASAAEMDKYRDANGKISESDLPQVKKIESDEKSKEEEEAKPLDDTKNTQLKALKTFADKVEDLDQRAMVLNQLIRKMNDSKALKQLRAINAEIEDWDSRIIVLGTGAGTVYQGAHSGSKFFHIPDYAKSLNAQDAQIDAKRRKSSGILSGGGAGLDHPVPGL